MLFVIINLGRRNYYKNLCIKIQNTLSTFCFFFYTIKVSAQKELSILTVPGKEAYTNINKNGNTELPSGRYVTPAGQTIQITHDPFGMAVTPDGTKTVTLHNGVFTIINNATLAHTRVPGYDDHIPSPLYFGHAQ